MHLRIFFALMLLMSMTFLTACEDKREPVQISTTEEPVTTEEDSPVYSTNTRINSTKKKGNKSSSSTTDGLSTGELSHFHSIPIKVRSNGKYETLGYVSVPSSIDGRVISNGSTHYYASDDGMTYHMYIVIGTFKNNDTAKDLMQSYASSMFDLENSNYRDKTITDLSDSANLYGVKLDYTDKNGSTNTRYYYAKKLSSRVLTVTVAAFSNGKAGATEAAVRNEFVTINNK